MILLQVVIASLISFILLIIVYHYIGWKNIHSCYCMWFDKKYWTNYNIIEIISWVTKAIIIIPGLVFGVQIWWVYFFALISSLTLIWASHKKLLPTLVGFNSLWVWLCCMVLIKNLIG